MKYIRSFFFALNLFVGFHQQTIAATIPWEKEKFTLVTNGMHLSKVLHELGAHSHIPIIVSEKIKDVYLGSLRSIPPETAFRNLVNLYNLAWYYNEQALYIYRADEVSYQLLSANVLKNSPALTDKMVLPKQAYCRVSLLPGTYVAEVWGVPVCVERFRQWLQRLEEQASYHEENQDTVELFPLRYANALDTTYRYRQESVIVPGVISMLREMVPGLITNNIPGQEKNLVERSAPTFTADPRQNAVVVRDKKNKMGLYASLIKQVDIKQPLIEVSVAIIDVDAEDLNALGIDWSASTKIGGGKVSFNAEAGLGSRNFSTVVANTGIFMVKLQALEQHSKAKVLSRPSVVTLNNVQAVLDRNITFYTKLVSEKAVKLESVAAGSLMRVTPRVVDENGKQQMMLTLNIEDGKQVSPSNEAEPLPQIQKSEIATQASLTAGQSLLLGGFVREEESEGERKIPLLGDLPVVGHLFRSNNKTRRSVVRLFLIKAEPLQ